MPITRTINYTQNVPISMGFSNYLTNAATASVEFLFSSSRRAHMGYISTSDVAGVDVTNQSFGPSAIYTSTILTGTMADLNTALNSALYQPHLYEADTVVQDFLSQDRALPSDFRGEFQIQIPPDTVHGLTVGTQCRLSTSLGKNYMVTKINSTNSAIRIWLICANNYDLSEQYYGEYYKFVGICKQTAIGVYSAYYLQTTSDVNIAPINDISYNNPYGDHTITMNIKNSAGTVLETGSISFVGSFFIAEPTFTTLPADSIATGTPDLTYLCNFGAIDQAEDNPQSVQLLMKYYENDPMYLGVSAYTALPGYPSGGTDDQKLLFIGDAINAKASLDIPAYVADNSLGMFSEVLVNNLKSLSPTTGVVRWHFYGTPADCNYALRNVFYFRAPGVTKEFQVETRIVNGRTRIYSARGK